MTRHAIVAVLALALAGCAASVGQTTAADGGQAYVASCGGIGGTSLLRNSIDCRLAATKACPGGYVPIEEVPGSGRLTFRCATAERKG